MPKDNLLLRFFRLIVGVQCSLSLDFLLIENRFNFCICCWQDFFKLKDFGVDRLGLFNQNLNFPNRLEAHELNMFQNYHLIFPKHNGKNYKFF
jgi:hypothetical protein